MTFDELKKIFTSEFQIIKLADMARELGVTPQVINNWKIRNQVPYNYVKILKQKLADENHHINKKIIIENSFLESLVKILRDNSKLISYLTSKIKIFLAFTFIFCVIVFALGKFYFAHKYESELKYVPLSNSGESSIASIVSLAERFGVSSAPPKTSNSLISHEMIPVYLSSKMIAERVIQKKFYTSKYGKKLKLLNIFSSLPDTTTSISELDRRDAIKGLQKSIKHYTANNGATSTISVTAFEPQLCVDILNQYVIELKKVFKSNFEEKNIVKKEFLKGRLVDTKKELTAVENELKIFREKNREIFKSPELQTQQSRLIRDVSVLTEVYINLKSEYEILLVNEKANISIFKIIDSPELPLYRISPNNTRNVLLTAIISMSLFISLAILMFYAKKNRKEVRNITRIIRDALA